MALKLVYITAATVAEAERIGVLLVEERLAACANVLGPIRSVYWWEGKLQREAEAVLIAKTRGELVEQLIDRVRALHAYTVPCVVALPIETGNPAFLRWIENETARPGTILV